MDLHHASETTTVWWGNSRGPGPVTSSPRLPEELGTRMGHVSRRAVLGGCGALLVAQPSFAKSPQPDGAVGLIVNDRGLAGLIFASEGGGVFDPSLAWHVGSNTKAMTAALYARLVDQGRCHWGAHLRELFAGIRLHPDWWDVTIEELSSHAAGLTDDIIDGQWLTNRRADPRPAKAQRRAFVAELLAGPRSGERGRYRYANANYVVVGAAMEAVTDEDWERLMRVHLFAPLRMGGAAFGAPPAEGIWGRDDSSGVLEPVDPRGIADNPSILWPSGGVRLPLGDYAHFLSIFLSKEPSFLFPATLQHLLTPSASQLSYAGGWSLDGAASDRGTVLTHNGSNSFWFAKATVYRQEKRGYAAIVNKGGAAGERVTTSLISRMKLCRSGR